MKSRYLFQGVFTLWNNVKFFFFQVFIIYIYIYYFVISISWCYNKIQSQNYFSLSKKTTPPLGLEPETNSTKSRALTTILPVLAISFYVHISIYTLHCVGCTLSHLMKNKMVRAFWIRKWDYQHSNALES